MSIRLRKADRDEARLLPPSIREWLPDDHLARFVALTARSPDPDRITGICRHGGKPAWCPVMMTALLFYGHATGVLVDAAGRKRQRMSRWRCAMTPLPASASATFLPSRSSRPGAVDCPHHGHAEVRPCRPRWHQGEGRCRPPPGDEPFACGAQLHAAEGRGRPAAGAGRGGRRAGVRCKHSRGDRSPAGAPGEDRRGRAGARGPPRRR